VQTRPPKFDLPQGLPLLFGENVVHFCGLKITKFNIRSDRDVDDSKVDWLIFYKV
jgi:hypothetical protein